VRVHAGHAHQRDGEAQQRNQACPNHLRG
jgi:hypothetical protein